MPMPNIHPVARALIEKFMDWDDVEQTWELHIPVPVSVEVIINDLPVATVLGDVMMCVDEVCENNGVTYSHFLLGKKSIKLSGLALN